jgi:hypothetical protein
MVVRECWLLEREEHRTLAEETIGAQGTAALVDGSAADGGVFNGIVWEGVGAGEVVSESNPNPNPNPNPKVVEAAWCDAVSASAIWVCVRRGKVRFRPANKAYVLLPLPTPPPSCLQC